MEWTVHVTGSGVQIENLDMKIDGEPQAMYDAYVAAGISLYRAFREDIGREKAEQLRRSVFLAFAPDFFPMLERAMNPGQETHIRFIKPNGEE